MQDVTSGWGMPGETDTPELTQDTILAVLAHRVNKLLKVFPRTLVEHGDHLGEI